MDSFIYVKDSFSLGPHLKLASFLIMCGNGFTIFVNLRMNILEK